MIEKLTKALQRMRDAVPAIMIPIYNFISAIADLIIKF
ncbi:tail length tape measure protein [Bacillus thuringiensis]|nr:tail length tape measure protein [Bacillus thuringiensis]